jgi:predicted DNA-binding protein
MELVLTTSQERRFAELSARTGRPPEDIVREALDAVLQHERWFAKGRGGRLPRR